MAIKGDGSSLTIALRGNYAQAAWANRSADVRLRVFLYRAKALPIALKFVFLLVFGNVFLESSIMMQSW
jgi:hypothetical protein